MALDLGLSKLQMVGAVIAIATTGVTLVARYIGLETKVSGNTARIESMERLNCAIADRVGLDVGLVETCRNYQPIPRKAAP